MAKMYIIQTRQGRHDPWWSTEEWKADYQDAIEEMVSWVRDADFPASDVRLVESHDFEIDKGYTPHYTIKRVLPIKIVVHAEWEEEA